MLDSAARRSRQARRPRGRFRCPCKRIVWCDAGLEAVLEIPDTNVLLARNRLACASEGTPQIGEQPRVVTLADVESVARPGTLLRGRAVDVLAPGIEDACPAVRTTVSLPHLLDEVPRGVGDVRAGARVVVAARRDRGDDTDRRVRALDRVVAARHQRLIRGGRSARAVAIELRLPEVAQVGLVPDVDGCDLRGTVQERRDEAAVRGP